MTDQRLQRLAGIFFVGVTGTHPAGMSQRSSPVS
jgi:hypothetical protein